MINFQTCCLLQLASGLTLTKMSAEHGHVEIDRNVMNETYLGRKVRLSPWDIGDTMNLYDYVNQLGQKRMNKYF